MYLWCNRYTGGEDKNGPIYLSILGEVYDVTTGKDFYAVGSGYSFFAGRDATICFFTGNYTVEHLNEKNILDYTGIEIMSMDEWRSFYEKHEEYRFLGVLEGEYYDSNGKETEYLLKIRETIAVAKKESEERERLRREELDKRRAARLANQAEKDKERAKASELWVGVKKYHSWNCREHFLVIHLVFIVS